MALSSLTCDVKTTWGAWTVWHVKIFHMLRLKKKVKIRKKFGSTCHLVISNFVCIIFIKFIRWTHKGGSCLPLYPPVRMWICGSSVSIVSGLRGWTIEKKNFLFAAASRPLVGPPRPPRQWVTGGSFCVCKEAWAWSWPLTSTSTEVKNAWNYIFTPLYVFMARYFIEQRNNFTALLAIFTSETTWRIAIKFGLGSLQWKLLGEFTFSLCWSDATEILHEVQILHVVDIIHRKLKEMFSASRD